jgi:hypothetical protein
MRASACQVVAIASCLGILFTACGDGTGTGRRASASNGEVCNLLTKIVAADSRIDRRDLASMRAQVPALSEMSAELAEIAPKAIRTEAQALSENTQLWRSTVEKPDLVLTPNTTYLWATPDSQAAGEKIRQWSLGNCDEPVDRESLKPGVFMVCLRADATAKDVQSVLGRTSIPSKTGKGNELLEGIAGVAARPRAVWVELDPFITPARKAQLRALLGAPPVDVVRENTDGCS